MPCVAAYRIATCFSTASGWYCGCLTISDSFSPRVSWSRVALSRSDANWANAARLRYCARSSFSGAATFFIAFVWAAEPTRDQLTRGEKLSEIVKQPQYQPLPVEKQVAILYVATTGKVDDIPTPRVKEFETGFYRFLETERPAILTELGKTKALSDELDAGLDEAVSAYRQSFLA